MAYPTFYLFIGVSTHSRAKAAAYFFTYPNYGWFKFQHTAARRRLLSDKPQHIKRANVSTHSRAEAAANRYFARWHLGYVSTHSRAEAAASSCFIA